MTGGPARKGAGRGAGMHGDGVPDSPHPALDDLAALLADELGGPAAARALAHGGQAACENTLRNAALLSHEDPVAQRRSAASQMWTVTWQAVGERHPGLFGCATRNLSGVGLAVAYARSKPGLLALDLTTSERVQLRAARRFLAELCALPELLRPPRAYLITAECRALRHVPELIAPGTIAMAVGSAASIGRPVLFTAAGLDVLRASGDEVSHLVLQLLHEELHIAFARRARPAHDSWSALRAGAEEAVVSALDLTADLWLRNSSRPTRDQLIANADTGNYAHAVRGLLRALPDENLHSALAKLGVRVVASRTEAEALARLNATCATARTRSSWRRTLALQ